MQTKKIKKSKKISTVNEKHEPYPFFKTLQQYALQSDNTSLSDKVGQTKDLKKY